MHTNIILQNNLWAGLGMMIIGYKFLVNLLSIFILIYGIYFHFRKDREFSFTFIIFNIMIFIVCLLMVDKNISMGFGFGLFAIFTVLRYRTDTIPIKEMTYLFTAITIALVNAIGKMGEEVYMYNVIILVSVFLMEKWWYHDHRQSTNILYEKLDLLQENPEAALEDIKARTGLNVVKYQIKSFNFLNDTASIRIYYIPKD